MATYSNSAREVEMPNGDVVVLHNAVTANTTSNIKKFKYDDNGHVTESSAANAEDLNLSSYSTPTTGSTAIGTSDDIQTAIGKLDHQSQIDQSNILYSSKTGAQNIIICSDLQRLKEMNPDSQYAWWEGNVYKSSSWSFTINGDGSITINGTFPAQTFFYLELSNSDTTRFKNNGIMRLTGCPSSGSENSYFICIRRTTPDYYWFDSGSGIDVNTSESNFITSPIQIFIGIRTNVTLSNQTFYPSLVLKTIYEQDSSFHIGALPNYDLTYLEAQDRASLAEVVDSGAKNLLQLPSGSATSCGITFSCDPSTGIVTANGTKQDGDCYMLLATISLTSFPRKFVAFCNNIDNAKVCITIVPHRTNGTYASTIAIDTYTTIDLTSSVFDSFLIRAASYADTGATLRDEKIYPMLCTKAAFGVSPKFVPYALSNVDLTPYVPKVSGGVYSVTTDYSCIAALTQYVPWSEGENPAPIARISAFISTGSVGVRGVIISLSDNVNNYDSGDYLLAKEEQQTAIQKNLQTFAMMYNGYVNQNVPVYVWVKGAAAGTIRAYSSIEVLRR